MFNSFLSVYQTVHTMFLVCFIEIYADDNMDDLGEQM